MMDIDGGIDEELQEYIPNTCSKSPAPGSYSDHYSTLLTNLKSIGHAFCKSHCEDVKALGYPTELKPFLKSCGTGISPVDPDQYTKEMMSKVNETVKTISKTLIKNPTMRSATDAQGKQFNIQFLYSVCNIAGTTYFLRKQKLTPSSFELEGDDGEDCNK
jgi:hypothetical protein